MLLPSKTNSSLPPTDCTARRAGDLRARLDSIGRAGFLADVQGRRKCSRCTARRRTAIGTRVGPVRRCARNPRRSRHPRKSSRRIDGPRCPAGRIWLRLEIAVFVEHVVSRRRDLTRVATMRPFCSSAASLVTSRPGGFLFSPRSRRAAGPARWPRPAGAGRRDWRR